MRTEKYRLYCHINKINGKKYFGISCEDDIEIRFGNNGNGYRTQVFGRAIKKYGWDNFIHVICFENLSKKDAKEIYFIDLYDTTNPKFGYNVSEGGDTPIVNEEISHKISNSISKLWENEEYRNHMSEVHKGQGYHGGGTPKGTHIGFDNANSQAVYIEGLDTAPFGSKSECAKYIGGTVAGISAAMKSNRSYKGYIIKYYNVV